MTDAMTMEKRAREIADDWSDEEWIGHCASAILAFAREVERETRERCAGVADAEPGTVKINGETLHEYGPRTAEKIAAAIRAMEPAP